MFNGKTPLHYASEFYSGDKALIELLVRLSDIDAIDHFGSTALHYASANGDPDVLGALVEQSQAINASNAQGETPLTLAVIGGIVEAFNLLILKGSDTSVKTKHSRTISHLAVQSRNLSMIKRILELGILKLDDEDEYGWTPVHFAAYYNLEAALKLFSEIDTKVFKAKNKIGRTPLACACLIGSLDAIKTIEAIDKELLEDTDDDGNTLLHIAVSKNCLDTVKYLVGKGIIDPNTVNRENLSPLQVAINKGLHEIAAFIQNL